ncbi:MAG: AsmA family protein [Beijerinckiaceae bacterium]
MKKVHAWGIAAAALVAAGVAAAVPWTFGDNTIRQQLANQIRLATGLDLVATENGTVALLPQPHIKIPGVRIKDRWNNLNVDIQVLKGNLRLLPLIAGRLEVSSLSLYLPTITLNVHARPLNDRGAIAKASQAVTSTPQAKAADSARLGAITITGGRILLVGGGQDTSSQIGDVNATLDWSSISAPARLDGSLIWRGEKVAVSSLVTRPGELLRGQSSALKLSVSSRLLEMTTQGQLSTGAGGQYQGKISASSPAIRPLVSITGAGWPLPHSISNVAIEGTINVRPKSVALAQMNLQIDGTKLGGALAVFLKDARPLVTATLATDEIKIDHRSANFPQLSGPDGRWNAAPLPYGELAFADFDLRLSARKASFDNLHAQDVALVAMGRDGNVETSLSSTKAYNGAIKVDLRIDRGPVLPSMRGSIRFEGLNAEPFLRDAARRANFSGLASGEIEFRTAGSNFEEMAKLLFGSLKIRLANGSLSGLDLGEALKLSQTQPLSMPDRIRGGKTPIINANAGATIREGKLVFSEAMIDSGDIKSSVSGAIHLAERRLDLSIATAHAAPAGSSQAAPVQLDLAIAGRWDNPYIAPNPDSLIMRSKAAESLLRGLRKLRDASSASPPAVVERP